MSAQEKTVTEALTSFHREAERLQNLGFITVASITVTKAKGKPDICAVQATLFVNPDGRFGILKIVPNNLAGSVPTRPGLLTPSPAADAFFTSTPAPNSPQAISQAIAAVVERGTVEAPPIQTQTLVSDGVVQDGNVCANCSGTTFQRRGSCLYCTNCAESVGGCS